MILVIMKVMVAMMMIALARRLVLSGDCTWRRESVDYPSRGQVFAFIKIIFKMTMVIMMLVWSGIATCRASMRMMSTSSGDLRSAPTFVPYLSSIIIIIILHLIVILIHPHLHCHHHWPHISLKLSSRQLVFQISGRRLFNQQASLWPLPWGWGGPWGGETVMMTMMEMTMTMITITIKMTMTITMAITSTGRLSWDARGKWSAQPAVDLDVNHMICVTYIMIIDHPSHLNFQFWQLHWECSEGGQPQLPPCYWYRVGIEIGIDLVIFI